MRSLAPRSRRAYAAASGGRRPHSLFEVRLVPDLVGGYFAAVPGRDLAEKVPVVCFVLGWAEAIRRVRRQRPARAGIDSEDEIQPQPIGPLDDVVELGPGRAAELGVGGLAFGDRLDLLPGELLSNPADARVAQQLEAALAFFGLDLLLQKDVHSNEVVHVSVRSGAWPVRWRDCRGDGAVAQVDRQGVERP